MEGSAVGPFGLISRVMFFARGNGSVRGHEGVQELLRGFIAAFGFVERQI
jgi:hypothetical protein